MATQKEIVLEHLRSGKSLTGFQALQFYGILRLPARVLELRNDGHPIKGEWITVPSRQGATQVKKYYMKEAEEVKA